MSDINTQLLTMLVSAIAGQGQAQPSAIQNPTQETPQVPQNKIGACVLRTPEDNKFPWASFDEFLKLPSLKDGKPLLKPWGLEHACLKLIDKLCYLYNGCGKVKIVETKTKKGITFKVEMDEPKYPKWTNQIKLDFLTQVYVGWTQARHDESLLWEQRQKALDNKAKSGYDSLDPNESQVGIQEVPQI
jgi:hypothetical protein